MELISEENKSEFLLRTFSVQQAKVSQMRLQYSTDCIFLLKNSSLPQHIRCGSSTSQSGAQTTSGVEM